MNANAALFPKLTANAPSREDLRLFIDAENHCCPDDLSVAHAVKSISGKLPCFDAGENCIYPDITLAVCQPVTLHEAANMLATVAHAAGYEVRWCGIDLATFNDGGVALCFGT